jgi:hypothetical protein
MLDSVVDVKELHEHKNCERTQDVLSPGVIIHCRCDCALLPPAERDRVKQVWCQLCNALAMQPGISPKTRN